MKYPQLVHMSGDVEHWLEKQLEARGVDGIVCAKYILSLIFQINSASPAECVSGNSLGHEKYGNKKCCQVFCNRQSWDTDLFKRLGVVRYPMSTLKENCDIEKLVDELCVKLKEIENNGTKIFDMVSNCESNFPPTANNPVICTDATLSGNSVNFDEARPFPSCNSVWTRGLLHDSETVKDQDKMEDYFSALFYENPADNLGFEFNRMKSDERQEGKEDDRINFYNKQNIMMASECTERLYERNTDVDKLIAKFDANIEGIWKPPYESRALGNLKYENIISENILTNSCLQNGSNVIWSFGQGGGNDILNGKKFGKPTEDKYGNNYKPTFSAWNKFPSPVFTPSSNSGINAMLNSVNLTLSNFQKWSAMDGQNDESSNAFLNRKKHESCFTEVIPKANVMGENHNLYAINLQEKNKSIGEEEDLLTSTKTHFRPIRMDEIHSNQTVAYADGTTFAISNELEKVTFTRSNSGVLYLHADSELETPRKYMEYKERETNTRLFDSESDLSVMEEFIPKFRVRQSNEKCCQTEDVSECDQIVPSMQEPDCDSDSYECDDDEFFFPGDSELVENIINKIDDEGKVEFRKITSDCNYNDIYVAENVGLNVLQKMSNASQCICSAEKNWMPCNEYDVRQEWDKIWGPQNARHNCKSNEEDLPTKDEYFRFREELTEEGEQLLSDLSCLQQLYSSSKWCDDESATTSDLNDEEAGNDVFCSSEFLNKLRSAKESLERKGYCFRKSEKSQSNGGEIAGQMEKVSKATEKNSSGKLNETRDRAFIIEKSQKERRRRNSSSQKICGFYNEGQYYRSHCRFSFCDSANPQPIYSAAPRIGGDTCEGSNGVDESLGIVWDDLTSQVSQKPVSGRL